jgi:lipoprotein-releasing system ATP-binding protein
MSQSGLSVVNLRKEYPTPGDPLVIIRDVSFSLNHGSLNHGSLDHGSLNGGEALAIMGPSGSGKSTLLYIIGALEPPTSGTVSVNGQNPFSLDAAGVAAFRNRQVGFIFQDHHLLPQCSALENVLIPTMAAAPARRSEDAGQRARRLLARVGLSDRLDHRPAELSGGERQRVAIARALINRPPLVLADEPTGNLDRRTAETVADLLLELYQEENTMLVLVTHSLELSKRFPRRAELLDGGLVLEQESPTHS